MRKEGKYRFFLIDAIFVGWKNFLFKNINKKIVHNLFTIGSKRIYNLDIRSSYMNNTIKISKKGGRSLWKKEYV